jgi:hypothetical protein
MDVTWTNNLMNVGKYTNFTYTATQVITGKDAKMSTVATPIAMFEPSTNSALVNYTSSDYPEITTDIRGRDRNSAAKLPGASEINGTVTSTMPVQSLVGAPFYNNPNTGITDHLSIVKPYIFSLYQQNIHFSTKETGVFYLMDLSGKIVYSQLIPSNFESQIPVFEKGIYLMQFITPQSKFVEKIIL